MTAALAPPITALAKARIISKTENIRTEDVLDFSQFCCTTHIYATHETGHSRRINAYCITDTTTYAMLADLKVIIYEH